MNEQANGRAISNGVKPRTYNVQTKKFNDNASHLLIEGGLLRSYLKHLGLNLKPQKGTWIVFDCPKCKANTAYIWHGKSTPIGWCCNGGCLGEKDGKDLLGLTRVATGKSFGELFGYIAGFLGFSNPFQITNMGEDDDQEPAEIAD